MGQRLRSSSNVSVRFRGARNLTATNLPAIAAQIPSGVALHLPYRFDNRIRNFVSLTPNSTRFYGSQNLVAATVIRLGSAAALRGTGHLTGSATITFGDVASLTDANSGVSPITGSAGITFGSAATIRNGNFGIAGTSAITFAGSGDLAPSKGKIRGHSTTLFSATGALNDIGQEPNHWVGLPLQLGFRRWGAPSVAGLSPRVISTTAQGAITGTATIQFGSIADLSAPAPLTASAAITIGSNSVLNNVGGPGTVQITGSAGITFGSSATLISVKPMTGSSTIRFINSGALKGRTRLVASEAITFTARASVRANTHIEGTSRITFDVSSPILDNIGVELIYGSCSITFSGSARGDVRYVKWQPEERKGGAWGEEVSSQKSWNKQTKKTGTWDEENL